jgi:8-oxo-dGTP diphosphatase
MFSTPLNTRRKTDGGLKMALAASKYCFRCGQNLKKSKTEGRTRFICSHCGWINYENPLPSAAAVVRNQAGHVLLVQRGTRPGIGRWALPSGFIEIEESPEEACLRELTEETNLRGAIRRLLGVYTQPSKTYKRVLIIAYEVEAEGELQAGTDTKDARFFSLENLPKIPFSSHRKIIQDILESEEWE